MMQPEDKIQEIAERAERLQEIGSSILRAARDELYLGMLFLAATLYMRHAVSFEGAVTAAVAFRSMDLARMEE